MRVGSVTPFDRAVANFKCDLSKERLLRTPEEDLQLVKAKTSRNSSVYLSAVYVVGNTANSLLKIGYADHLKTRISGMNTGSPVELRLLHFVYFVDGILAKNIEGDTHRKLSAYRRRGEWFEVTLEQAAQGIAESVAARGYRWWSEAERIGLADFIKRSYERRQERVRLFG